MANVRGAHITIKAWLPLPKDFNAQFAAMQLIKQAHETGDYAALLKVATVEGVQIDNKVRRMDDPQLPLQAEAEAETGSNEGEDEGQGEEHPDAATYAADETDFEPPQFLKEDGKRKARA